MSGGQVMRDIAPTNTSTDSPRQDASAGLPPSDRLFTSLTFDQASKARLLDLFLDGFRRFEQATGRRLDRISLCPVCVGLHVHVSGAPASYGDCCSKQCWDKTAAGSDFDARVAVEAQARRSEAAAKTQRDDGLRLAIKEQACDVYRKFRATGNSHDFAKDQAKYFIGLRLRRAGLSPLPPHPGDDDYLDDLDPDGTFAQ